MTESKITIIHTNSLFFTKPVKANFLKFKHMLLAILVGTLVC